MSVRAFANAVPRRMIMGLAGPRSFERGDLYAQQRRVKKLAVSASSASAMVHGTGRYRVELTLDGGGELAWACTCPVGIDGGFCKHCVAVALAARGGHDSEVPDDAAAAVDVAAYVRELDHERLVELVCGLAANDELLDARLRLDAARALTGATSPPLRPFKDAIDAAFVTGDYVDYRHAYDYAATSTVCSTASRIYSPFGSGTQRDHSRPSIWPRRSRRDARRTQRPLARGSPDRKLAPAAVVAGDNTKRHRPRAAPLLRPQPVVGGRRSAAES